MIDKRVLQLDRWKERRSVDIFQLLRVVGAEINNLKTPQGPFQRCLISTIESPFANWVDVDFPLCLS